MDAVYVQDGDGQIVCQAGKRWRERSADAGSGVPSDPAAEDISDDDGTQLLSNSKIVTYVACRDGRVQTVIDKSTLSDGLDMTSFKDIFSAVHVNTEEVYDILSDTGTIIVGTHSGGVLSRSKFNLIKSNTGEKS